MSLRGAMQLVVFIFSDSISVYDSCNGNINNIYNKLEKEAPRCVAANFKNLLGSHIY